MKIFDQIRNKDNIREALETELRNSRNKSPGIDGMTPKDGLNKEEMVDKIYSILPNYTPKPTKRIYIDKPGGGKRPLGIACFIDKVIQRAIKQIIERIVDPKFYKHSYGFRPGRSVSNCISTLQLRGNIAGCFYCIKVDIESFFDNVIHSKVLNRLKTLGIRCNKTIDLIERVMKGRIEDKGKLEYPKRGTPQGGILSPLLANVALDRLDKFIASKCDTALKFNKTTKKYQRRDKGDRGVPKDMRSVWLTRYADDFVISCDTLETARIVKTDTINFIERELGLKISQNKTGIFDLKKEKVEFLGFDFYAKKKYGSMKGYTMRSNICNKAKIIIKSKVKKLLLDIKNGNSYGKHEAISNYNRYIVGMQNYYRLATYVAKDLDRIQFDLRNLFDKVAKKKATRNETYIQRFGKGKGGKIYWINETPLFQVWIKQKNPSSKKTIPTDFEKNLLKLEKEIVDEYTLLRYKVYKRDEGICRISKNFTHCEDYELHHKIYKNNGGKDELSNCVLVSRQSHIEYHKRNGYKTDTLQWNVFNL